MTLPFSVLVTRPSPQGEALCTELERQNFHSIFLPVMTIKPLITPLLQNQIKQLNEYDWAIFLSRHAVATSLPSIKKAWPELPAGLKIAAVGEGTAQSLNEAGVTVSLCPEQWSSEGLLATSELQEIVDNKIAIFCGKDGRKTLEEVLRQRGAEVTSFMSYQREITNTKMSPYYALLAKHKINAVIATSGQSLTFLKQLFSNPKTWAELSKIPLVLISERIMIKAQALGFTDCYLAKNASHEGIIEALQKIRNNAMTTSKNHKTDAHSEVANPMVATAPAPRSHRLFWLAVIGFSGLMIAALVGAYILHHTIQLSLSTASQQLQNTQEQVAQLQERFANMQQTLQSQQDTLDQQTKLTSDLQFKNLNNVLVAQHWVQLANNYFLLTANIPHAINFLGQALNELDKVSDPQSIVLKQALQNDLATLRNIPWVNPYDVYNRVTRLQQQVLQLPLLQVPTQDKASNLLPPLENASSSFWRQSVQTAWDALRQMIVVHHLPNANTPPFIMPDQRPYIYQNLYVLLNETLWAVLNEDVDIYHASLKRVSDWINQYFDLSAPAVTSVLGELAQLQSITLQPAKGVMLTSPKAFQDYLKNS